VSPDSATIAIRERSLPELYDLALLVVRRRPWPPLLLVLIGAGPWLALDAWLLLGSGSQTEPWAMWYPLLLLIAAQTPLAFAPLTAWLGAAMFSERPSLREALRDGWRPWFALLVAGVLHGVLALFPLLLLFWPAHLSEVLVLERQRLRPAWRRASALRGVASGGGIVHLLVAALVSVASLWCLAGTVQALGGLLLHADPWTFESWHLYMPGRSVLPHVAVWIAAAWLTIVRFLWYIDLRTRCEGWAVDLELRENARRLEGRP